MAEKKSESNSESTKLDNKSLFSNENINMGRQSELDYLKTLGIFLMVVSHIYDNYSVGYFEKIIYFLSFILGAGGFMLLMGIGMKYSRHHDTKNYIARGLGLLTIGQYVNLLRDTLPNFIAWKITKNKIFLSRALLVLQADILTFAGFAFLLLAVFKKLKFSDTYILIISIIMNVGAYPLYKKMKSPDNFLLSQILGYFVLTNAEAYFPLFSYFIFVAFGYWLGGIFQKISNKDKFYNLVLIICFSIVTIYYYYRSHYDFPLLPKYFSDEHYCLSPGPDAIMSCLTNLTALAIFHKIDNLLKGKTPEFITHAAANLNQYYIISYLFITPMNTFLIATKGENYPKQTKYPTGMAIMVIIFCRVLIDINDKYINFTITTLKNPMRNVIFSLIWIITIISVIYIYPKLDVYATLWNNYLKTN